jgi:hypothetical protein
MSSDVEKSGDARLGAAPSAGGGITPGLVHVRTPTYQRPGPLERCLRSLIAQSHSTWICDVFDDDPDAAGRAVVAALGDPRIRYSQNRPQKLATGNIDRCFTSENPYGAEYFCVLEDDNFLLPEFFAANIADMARAGVEIVLRNQLVEFNTASDGAHVSRGGLLDERLTERCYEPAHLRLAVLADIGVSCGGLFWSCRSLSDLEIHLRCSATLQEYLRTFAIAEPIHVAMRPLAVWAESGEGTNRNQGEKIGWLRRELALKASVARLQRHAWRTASPEQKAAFLEDEAFRYPAEQRARGLVKSLVRLDVGAVLPLREVVRLAVRGLLIRIAGRPEPSVQGFVSERVSAQ